MGIILGLTAACFWGVADFFARYVTQRIGTYRTLFLMQIVGFAALTVYMLGSGELARQLGSSGWLPWVWACLAGVLGLVGSLALYRAFEVGVLSVVSPIAASYAALTALLSILSGESLSLVRALGIVAAILGVMLASTQLGARLSAELSKSVRSKGLPRGVAWALLAALVYGFGFWTLGFHVTPYLGGVTAVWFLRLITISLLPLLAQPLRQDLRLPTGSSRIILIACAVGALDTLAFMASLIGLTTDQVSVVSVICSLFSAVTVILAWIFLHERLARNQWVGIGVIFLGIVLVNVH